MFCLDEKLDIFLVYILFIYCFIVDVMWLKEIYIKIFNCFEIWIKLELLDLVIICFNCIVIGFNMVFFFKLMLELYMYNLNIGYVNLKCFL